MVEREWVGVGAKDAAEICRRFALSEGAAGVPAAGVAPRDFLKALTSAGHYEDAEAFLAYALPKREAVWWACLCAREAAGPSPGAAAGDAIRAAERWVTAPDDANRREAMAAAEAVGLGTPAGAAGVAAFTGGGSVAPLGLPDVPAGDHHTPHAVACAARMAALLIKPGPAEANHRRLIDLGSGVAEGRLKWPDSK